MSNNNSRMKVVYIAHPISGDVQANLEAIRRIVREINITDSSVVPFAPYWLDCHALDDSILAERDRGIKNDQELIKRCVDEVWCYGLKISNGMKAEIELAYSLNIPILFKSENLQEAGEYFLMILEANDEGKDKETNPKKAKYKINVERVFTLQVATLLKRKTLMGIPYYKPIAEKIYNESLEDFIKRCGEITKEYKVAIFDLGAKNFFNI